MISKLVVVVLALASAQAFPFENGRVVGGANAKAGQFPYQISLQYQNKDIGMPSPSHVCGGSILNQNWIVTAGHCVTEIPQTSNSKYFVHAGIISLKDSTAQVRSVVQIQVNPNYQGGVGPNDIALMKLDSPLTLNANVKAIKLPASGENPSGSSTLSGWGSTSTTTVPKYPDRLQFIALPLLSYQDCANALIKLMGSSRPLVDTNVCTGPLTGGQGACSGDSGGPLVVYDSAKVPTLEGIVSWGMVPCGTRGAPSVYTRVSAFLPFINQYIGQ